MRDVYERHNQAPVFEETAAYRDACARRGVDELTIAEGGGRRQTRDEALAVLERAAEAQDADPAVKAERLGSFLR